MISVIIPLYNKEQSIFATLQSVCAQTYTDFELLVVDDGSSDNSADIAGEYSDTRIRLIHKENGGVCSARNRGILEAKGEYIALLDADDQWEINYLEEQMRLIRDFPKAAMWGINYAELSNGRLVRKLETGLPDGYRGYVDNYFQMPNRVSDLFCSSSVVIRRDVFDRVGMFDERIKYSEDIDMWYRIIAKYPVAFYDRYMVRYLYDAENRAMNRKRLLKYWLPYYVDKYRVPLYQDNKVFYRWIMRWCGTRIKLVYFNDPLQYEDAKLATMKLDYSQLPFKYRFELRTPKWMGKIIYRILK